jgi:hypothetical protein
MINLIPKKGHKTVKYEYILRVGATLGFLFTGMLLLLSASLIPTYVLVDAQIKAFESEKKQLSETDATFKEADNEVELTKEILAQLKRSPNNARVSEVVEEIRSVAPNSIVFTNFITDATKGSFTKIQVKGQAPTRKELAELKNTLESSEMFASAEVPIGDLARDVDVPFAIAVTLKKN